MTLNKISIDKSLESVLYELNGTSTYSGKITKYLFSSPESKSLMFNPYNTGITFQASMETIVTKVYKLLCQDLLKIENRKVCTLYILRGGLNFAFHKAISDHNVEASFISCQRVFDQKLTGANVSDDGYQKINLKDGGILFIGDIAATGITIENILKKVISNCNQQGIRISSLIIVMIGTQQSHEYLTSFLTDNSDVFDRINLIYLEALFDLFDSNIELNNNHLKRTDFFVNKWARTPEFEIELLNNLGRLSERCAIYDGGSRSFEPELYMHGVKTYWDSTFKLFSERKLLEYICLKSDFEYYLNEFDIWQNSRPYFDVLTEAEKYDIYKLGQKKLKEIENINISRYFYDKQ